MRLSHVPIIFSITVFILKEKNNLRQLSKEKKNNLQKETKKRTEFLLVFPPI